MHVKSLLFAAAGVALSASSAFAASSSASSFTYGTPSTDAPGVVGTSTNGPTNPSTPSLGTAVNQSSVARLLSINSVDDFCTFSSPNGELIADTESYTVAYCTQARNDARVIPDGTFTAVHFVKTPLYVQVMALGDLTKIGIQAGDSGGELDPHGATGKGNPVGGNVTSNITGSDVFYEEWMNYVGYDIMCIRVCIAGSDAAPTSAVCQHTLDEVGCEWVMPGDYTDDVFDTCEADAAWPPGIYIVDGTTSSFQQYYSSVYTDTANGVKYTFVNGSPDETTPTAAYSQPASSSCTTTSTIANNIASLVSSSGTASSSSASSSASSSSSGTKKSSSSTTASSSSSSASSSTSSTASSDASSLSAGSTFAGVAAAFGAFVGALVML